MIIGVGGRFCTGKSIVCKTIALRGFYVIDVDYEGHKALEQKTDEVVAHFGTSVLTNNGAIDRKKLGAKVFAHKASLRALEAIVHPLMRHSIDQQIKERSSDNIVLDAALLYPLRLDRYCDAIFWVHARLLQRIQRARQVHLQNAATAQHKKRFSYIRIAKLLHTQRHLNLNFDNNFADVIYVVNNRSISALQAVIQRHLDVLIGTKNDGYRRKTTDNRTD